MSSLEINIQIIGGSSVSGPQRLQANILHLCDGGKGKREKYVCTCWSITVIITQVSRETFQKIIKKNRSNYYLFEYQKKNQLLLHSTI